MPCIVMVTTTSRGTTSVLGLLTAISAVNSDRSHQPMLFVKLPVLLILRLTDFFVLFLAETQNMMSIHADEEINEPSRIDDGWIDFSCFTGFCVTPPACLSSF